MQSESSRTRELGGKWLASAGHAAKLKESPLVMRDFEIRHSRATDTSHHGEYEGKITESAKSVAQSIDALRPLLQGEQELAMMSKLGTGWAQYSKAIE
ncbi:MAG: hypothetical protein ING89_07770 [Rubrivivax sp.]|nr:hypothetical protein [Rubrivivax sp.]